jgi:hypothetical protein
VAGVNYDFHQFTAGLNDTNGLTAANKVSSGTWTSTLTALPGQELDSDDNNYGLVFTGYINVPTDGTYTSTRTPMTAISCRSVTPQWHRTSRRMVLAGTQTA